MKEYIDRDVLLERIRGTGYVDQIKENLLAAAVMIPAAFVRPVVMGEWIPTWDKNKKRCSRCDVIHLIAQYPHGEANFCPNCGADMRGIVNETKSDD